MLNLNRRTKTKHKHKQVNKLSFGWKMYTVSQKTSHLYNLL